MMHVDTTVHIQVKTDTIMVNIVWMFISFLGDDYDYINDSRQWFYTNVVISQNTQYNTPCTNAIRVQVKTNTP